MKYFSRILLDSCLLLFCLSFLGAAAAQQATQATEPADRSRPSEVGTKIAAAVSPDEPFTIADVALSRRSFNPSRGDTVVISCRLSHPARVFVQIFDPDDVLVRELLPDDTGNPGFHEVLWDGRDLEGNIVPDEAYYFTIEANAYTGELTTYEPIPFSSGKSLNFTLEFNPTRQMLIYELAKDARVLIRAGIKQGPLLKTIVDWEPRLAGIHAEPWDGTEASGAIYVYSRPGFAMMSDAVTLPENSVLSVGNKRYSYSDYKSRITSDRPIRESRPAVASYATRTDLPFSPPVWKRDEPTFSIDLPHHLKKNEQGHPIAGGKLPVRIVLDENVRTRATEQRYEIICYVDFKFMTEQEEGYSPSSWLLDTKTIPDGEHILTVNVATLNGGIASSSVTVFVQNH